MKQKKIGDILYVFDQTPYVITQDTDVAVINIQNEAVSGFKLINNETVNAKIKGYNYFTMTVKKLEWADYVDNYTVTVAATSNGTCTVDKTDADPGEEITITTTPATGYELDTLSVTAGGESVTVTNNKFTMPAANVTVTATFKLSLVTLNPLWYDEGGNVITSITATYDPMVRRSVVFSLCDKTTDPLKYVYFTDGQFEDPGCTFISANISGTNVDIAEYGSEGQAYQVWLDAPGTGTVTVTWAQQEVDGVMYASGSATINVTIEKADRDLKIIAAPNQYFEHPSVLNSGSSWNMQSGATSACFSKIYDDTPGASGDVPYTVTSSNNDDFTLLNEIYHYGSDYGNFSCLAQDAYLTEGQYSILTYTVPETEYYKGATLTLRVNGAAN